MTFLIRLDAHVAGVAPDKLGLTAVGERQLHQRIESFLDMEGRLLMVASADGASLVGMGNIHIWHHTDIWANPERQSLRSGYIDDIWVEPEWRGKGVARDLVAALIAYAQAEDINELVLEYALHNREADTFWRRLGFRPTGVRAAAQLSDVLRNMSFADRPPPTGKGMPS